MFPSPGKPGEGSFLEPRLCCPPIRILIADDHTLMRQCIRHLLRTVPDFQIVGEAKNGIESVHLAARLQPDVILMDVEMPQLDGISATRIILKADPRVKIIGLSMHLMEDIGFKMLAAGAKAFVCKSDAKHLVEKIRAYAGDQA